MQMAGHEKLSYMMLIEVVPVQEMTLLRLLLTLEGSAQEPLPLMSNSPNQVASDVTGEERDSAG